MRLIDADALHDALKAKQKWVVRCGDKHNEGYTYDQVHFAIDDAPTIEPTIEIDAHQLAKLLREGWTIHSEPKQGEWIKHDEERDYCSVCKHIFKTRTLTKQDKWTTYVDDLGYNYCPNCGCRMKGADDE